MFQIFSNPKFEFIGRRRGAYVVSACIIGAGLLSVVSRGGLDYGIDFSGGLSLHVEFEDSVPTEAARESIASLGIEGFEIQSVEDEGEALIRVPVSEDSENQGAQILGQLRTDLGSPVKLLATDLVGSKVGDELKGQAIQAVIIALLAIVAYVSLRFQYRFGIAAIVTLTHDILCVLGILSILGIEISLPIVAALLTIVGYSLNDTIVVFDRIREDITLMRRSGYGEIINTSINKTLSRTVITSVTTLFPVVMLVILGGSVIHDFAVALLIGVLVGTYSSIFVASPILFEWNERKPLPRK